MHHWDFQEQQDKAVFYSEENRIHVNTRLKGFYWGCNTDSAKHLHYTKSKSIYTKLGVGGWGAALKQETTSKTNDGEGVEGKWEKSMMECGSWGRSQTTWDAGRWRESPPHGRQAADWWWWKWQWGRKKDSLRECGGAEEGQEEQHRLGHGNLQLIKQRITKTHEWKAVILKTNCFSVLLPRPLSFFDTPDLTLSCSTLSTASLSDFMYLCHLSVQRGAATCSINQPWSRHWSVPYISKLYKSFWERGTTADTGRIIPSQTLLVPRLVFFRTENHAHSRLRLKSD